MSKAKETTALNPSVGADGGQSSKTYTPSIAGTEEKFNENFLPFQDFFRKPQWDRGLNTQADGQPTDMSLNPCRAMIRDDATTKYHPPKHRRNRRASSRREEFGLLGRQSDREKAAAGRSVGKIISLSPPVNNTSRRPSGIGGTPNRPGWGNIFPHLGILFSPLSLQKAK